MDSTVVREPVLIITLSPRRTRVPPSGSATSIVLGPMKRPDPISNCAPLALKLARCISTSPLTILRLRSRTADMLIWVLSLVMPNSPLLQKYEATFALWMIFLLGRQAMLGQEPPIYFRSMTTARIPFLAEVQALYLPASPLPSTTRSYSSAVVCIDSVTVSSVW